MALVDLGILAQILINLISAKSILEMMGYRFPWNKVRRVKRKLVQELRAVRGGIPYGKYEELLREIGSI